MTGFWPLFVGGVVPAILWGITAIFQKQSAVSGVGSSAYLIAFGLTLAVAGGISALIWPAPSMSFDTDSVSSTNATGGSVGNVIVNVLNSSSSSHWGSLLLFMFTSLLIALRDAGLACR